MTSDRSIYKHFNNIHLPEKFEGKLLLKEYGIKEKIHIENRN